MDAEQHAQPVHQEVALAPLDLLGSVVSDGARRAGLISHRRSCGSGPRRAAGLLRWPRRGAEGFIHFPERHQVQGVADRYYAGKTGLVLLAVEESKLGGSPLKRENTSGGTELFPHVYGPVPIDAVTGHAPFERDASGRVVWPAGFA